MFNSLDLIFGIFAWLCVPFVILYPFIVVHDYRVYILPVWALCVGATLLLRRRPWRELWGVWLSGIVLWDESTITFFFVFASITLSWAGATIKWLKVFKRENLDYILCLIAWFCALSSRVARKLPLPGDWFDYDLYYFPVLWLCCIVCLPIVRKHPWRELWWVFLSGPLVFLTWEVIFYLAIAM
jgi:hypothetical protein